MKSPILLAAITILASNLTVSSANLFNENGLRGRQRREGAGEKRNDQLAKKRQKQQQGGGEVRGRKRPAKKSSQGRNNKPNKKVNKKKDKPSRNNNEDKDKKNKKDNGKKDNGKKNEAKNRPNKKNQGQDKPNKKNQGKNKPSRNPGRDYDPRIVGGKEATAHEHKFAVSLEERGSHFCGGSLITRDFILTAAHCNGGTYDVTLGKHDLSKGGGQTIGIEEEFINPGYQSSTTDGDFMVVKLKSPAQLNGQVALVTLNDNSGTPSVNEEVIVMGWGETQAQRGLASKLQVVPVNILSQSDCENSSDGRDSYKGDITNNMICAAAANKDSCQGDSGGPLITKNGKQVGVVSWGIGCASKDFPGVYAEVSKAYKWIERTVCAESDFASDAGFNCGGGGGNLAPSATPPISANRPPAPSPKPPKPNKPPSPKPPKPQGISNNQPSGGFSGSSYFDDDDKFWDSYLSGGFSGGGGGSGGSSFASNNQDDDWDYDYDDDYDYSGGGNDNYYSQSFYDDDWWF